MTCRIPPLRRRLLVVAIASALAELGGATQALAAPTGGQVIAGTATIVSSPRVTAIDQSSHAAIINWASFNVGGGEAVRFSQPDAGAVTLNRVLAIDPSKIDGSITANGRIFIVNPNGVVFGSGARVDVGGLVVTSADVDNQAFMAGRYAFTQASPNVGARIENSGLIRIADTGLAALVAPEVANHGVITARLGAVTLGGHATFTLDLAGDGLIAFDTGTAAPFAGSVANDGSIVADGGSVRLDAGAAAGVVGGVIDMSGVVQARSVTNRGGTIVLSGTAIDVSGELDASSSSAGNGGTILIGGDRGGSGPDRNALTTTIAPHATIRADGAGFGDGGQVVIWSDQATRFDGTISARGGAAGKGGSVETSSRGMLTVDRGRVDASGGVGAGIWLMDPTDITISNSTSGGVLAGGVFTPSAGTATVDAGAIASALAGGTNVTISTSSAFGGSGDITVASPIAKPASATNVGLTLTADHDINVNQSITSAGGRLALNLSAANAITVNGAVSLPSAMTATANVITLAPGAALTLAAEPSSGAQSIFQAPSFTQSAGSTIAVAAGMRSCKSSSVAWNCGSEAKRFCIGWPSIR